MINNKVFLVTAEGYPDSYGSIIVCLGIFSNREDAEKACDKYRKYDGNGCDIDEIVMNHVYMNDEYPDALHGVEDPNIIVLGGYIE